LGYSPIREAHQTIEAIITFIRKIEKQLPLDITKSKELRAPPPPPPMNINLWRRQGEGTEYCYISINIMNSTFKFQN